MRRLVFVVSFLMICGSQVLSQRPADNVLMALEREAQSLMQQEKFPEAAAIFTRIIEATGLEREEDYLALFRRAICYYYSGSFEPALSDINKFMPHNPGRSTPYVLRSFLYRSLGDHQSVLADLNQALVMNTGEQDSTQLLRLRSTTWLELKNYREALLDVKKSMSAGEDPEGLGIIAFAHFQLDETDQALQSVNRSIELDHTYLPVYLYAASFLLENGLTEKALAYARLATMVDDSSDDAWFYLGVSLINLNQVDAGCRCLSKAFYSGNENATGYLTQYCYPSEN